MFGEFTDLFTIIGFASILTVVVLLISTLAYELTHKIEDWMYSYRIKHRFDKPPTAKCYCRDCQYHDPETRRCYKLHENTNQLTGDASFCWEAEPRKRKDEVK